MTKTTLISKKIAITEKVVITNKPSKEKSYSFIIAPGMSGEAFEDFKTNYEHQIKAAIIELQFQDEISVEAMPLDPAKLLLTDEDKKFMLCFKYGKSNWCYSLPLKPMYLQTISIALAAYYDNKINDNRNGNKCEYKIVMFYNEKPTINK